jgi:DNA gyrase subunit A
MGRTAAGVYGIRLRDGDRVVAMGLAKPDRDLLVITQYGIGKRTPVDEYPQQGRRGQGVATLKNVDKVGIIVAAAVVDPSMEMVLMSAGGQVIRQPVKVVRRTARNTQGVRLMRLSEGDTVVTMACLQVQNGTVATTDDTAETDADLDEAASDGAADDLTDTDDSMLEEGEDAEMLDEAHELDAGIDEPEDDAE